MPCRGSNDLAEVERFSGDRVKKSSDRRSMVAILYHKAFYTRQLEFMQVVPSKWLRTLLPKNTLVLASYELRIKHVTLLGSAVSDRHAGSLHKILRD